MVQADREALLGTFVARAQQAPPDHLVDVLIEVAAAAGASDPVLYFIDHESRILTRAPVAGVVDQDRFGYLVKESTAGKVYHLQHPFEIAEDGGVVRLWLPVTETSDRLGVLSLKLEHPSEELRDWCEDLARVTAQLVRTRERYTDIYARARRLEPMALAAELQWSLLPPLNFTCDGLLSLAGIIEPAYHIGGDVIDYSWNAGVLQCAVVDSMGHGLDSAVVASLVVGTYRYCRRKRDDLLATVETIDVVVAEQFGGDRFATAQFFELDTRARRLAWVNAGHPLPFLLRRGDGATQLSCPPRLPLGLGGDPAYVAEVDLEDGDRLFIHSDGVGEARDADGEHFAAGSLQDLLLPDQPMLADLARAVVEGAIAHQEGPLRDDASVLVVELLGR